MFWPEFSNLYANILWKAQFANDFCHSKVVLTAYSQFLGTEEIVIRGKTLQGLCEYLDIILVSVCEIRWKQWIRKRDVSQILRYWILRGIWAKKEVNLRSLNIFDLKQELCTMLSSSLINSFMWLLVFKSKG